MRVCVTGGTGFLGRHTVEALLEAGHEVRVFSRRGWPIMDDRIDEICGSVLDDDACNRAVEGCDAVIHLAGRVSRDPDDAGEMLRLHVDGTRRVMAAAKAAGVKRVVYMSTSGTIGVSDDPEFIADENNAYPVDLVSNWPYYLSKIYAEQEALRWHYNEGLPVIVLNPTLLLGPGDEDCSSTEDVERFLKGMIPFAAAGGMSFVDVRDVAEMAIAALEKGSAGERYLLGSRNTPLRAFFDDLARMAGRPAPIMTAPERVSKWGASLMGKLEGFGLKSLPITRIDMEMASHGWYINSAKAKRELGFDPRHPDQTLRETIDDVLDRI